MRTYFHCLIVSCLLVVAACGLLNAALGSSGYAPAANTPEAKEKAVAADKAAWDWLGTLIGIGGAAAAGATGENVRQRRKRKRANATITSA